MRAIAATAFLSLIALASPAQTLVETIEVRVVNVDVVVRDRQGNPVSGLTKDDFALTVDGKPQPITNFYEVRRGEDSGALGAAPAESAVPPELRQRRIVVVVDCASLTPARRAAVLQSLEKFIDTRISPEDRAMLVAWHMSLDVVTPFTTDKDELKRGLRKLSRFAPIGEGSRASIDMLQHDIQDLIHFVEIGNIPAGVAYSEAQTMVDRHGEQLLKQEELLVDALGRVAGNMAGLDGKKVLVFVGEHFPEKPGAEFYRYIHDQFEPYLSRNNPLDLQVMTGLVGNDMQSRLEQLTKDASADGVTVYTIGAAESDSDFSAENDSPVDNGYSFSRDANTASALQSLADGTGGIAITRSSNFDLAFDTISQDLASYYSLGYRPPGEGFQQHKVVVTTKNRAYSVRSRETVVVKSTDDQMSDRAIANLYTAAASSWQVAIRVGQPKQDGRHFLIPVQVVMPPSITLMPRDQTLEGGFTIYLVVGNDRGLTSEVMRRPVTLKIPASAEAAVRAKPMTFTTAIRVNGGESTLSVAVIDQLSGAMGFARAKIVTR